MELEQLLLAEPRFFWEVVANMEWIISRQARALNNHLAISLLRSGDAVSSKC
jgi:hypothetical protein